MYFFSKGLNGELDAIIITSIKMGTPPYYN